MRTTVDIDDRILKDLKKIQRQERQSLGRLISNLLAQALGQRQSANSSIQPTRWISKPMGVRVDLADREAVYQAMEQGTSSARSSKKT
jgi:hypothetical protein